MDYMFISLIRLSFSETLPPQDSNSSYDFLARIQILFLAKMDGLMDTVEHWVVWEKRL